MIANKGKSVPIKIGIDTAAKNGREQAAMSEARTVCGLFPGEARAVCEWSKGGGQGSPDSSGRWTAHVEAKGWYEFLPFFSAKTMTAHSALHEAATL
jgi:hypothetical protein